MDQITDFDFGFVFLLPAIVVLAPLGAFLLCWLFVAPSRARVVFFASVELAEIAFARWSHAASDARTSLALTGLALASAASAFLSWRAATPKREQTCS